MTSIQLDADFVVSVADAFGLPLVANERCGSWYIPLERKAESVYFKSTDGHMNEWSFSLRRLNYQALDLVGKLGGCVIVDSTRRGKSMPDALSKTIPIWCCVMNRAIFAEYGEHEFHTPPQAVSKSEHAQIEKRIDGFVREFLGICKPDISLLRRKLQKPLRPMWILQDSSLPDTIPSFPDFHPVVLCTASRRVHGAEGSEGGYIQGAADDHEAWSQGLTPTLFWSNKEKLLSTNEEHLPDLIKKLIVEEKGQDAMPILVKPTSSLYIANVHNVKIQSFDVIISCTPEPLPALAPEATKPRKHLYLPCQTGKLGSRDLRTQLPRLPIFFTTLSSYPGRILICDPTGKDLAVGVALAILCLYTDSHGTIYRDPTCAKIDKSFIKQRFTWLTTTHPTLNPPRGTLQSINAFLMPDPSKQAFRPSPPPPLANASLLPLISEPSVKRPCTTTSLLSAPPVHVLNDMNSKPPSISSTIFESLQNNGKAWTFTRTLTSQLLTHPSGTVTGTATITPLTIPSSNTPALLYSEVGEFATTTGLRFSARRKYVYLLKRDVDDAAPEYIAVHFHEEDKEKVTGELFVEMGALEMGGGGEWRAKNKEQHLCAEDWYGASWEFGRGMVGTVDEEHWWVVRYDVKGPKKDYMSETKYSRIRI
ncbi:tRNA A64-2'-O-ribosylphosphate transferase [Kalmusia sp. IMI 367209]|nr:tRNA A64-2'-O-ribosylphosphate transferase [Kalmusia sp. IMI 367209]